MVDYELIDHTADIGIKVKGKNLKSLFINSAKAMFDLIAQKPKSSKGLKKAIVKIDIAATGREELLVRWLSELLSLSDSKDLFFVDFKINEMTNTSLKGKVAGVLRRYFMGKREVKAVTYHGLAIRHKENCCQAEVIFDV